VLLPTPPERGFAAETDPPGLCACSSRQGLAFETLLNETHTGVPPGPAWRPLARFDHNACLSKAGNNIPVFRQQDSSGWRCGRSLLAAGRGLTRGRCVRAASARLERAVDAYLSFSLQALVEMQARCPAPRHPVNFES
jgi:hypothetical protein